MPSDRVPQSAANHKPRQTNHSPTKTPNLKAKPSQRKHVAPAAPKRASDSPPKALGDSVRTPGRGFLYWPLQSCSPAPTLFAPAKPRNWIVRVPTGRCKPALTHTTGSWSTAIGPSMVVSFSVAMACWASASVLKRTKPTPRPLRVLCGRARLGCLVCVGPTNKIHCFPKSPQIQRSNQLAKESWSHRMVYSVGRFHPSRFTWKERCR